MSGNKKNFDRLFNPKSVAVVGASKSIAKTGTTILFSILAGEYKGEIYPINPKEKTVMGLKAYPNLQATPTNADLAIVCVKSEYVPSVIKECGDAGVGFAVVISSGFGEVSPQGKALEADILEAAKPYKTRIIGPNCMGMVSAGAGFFALMNMLIPKPGNVSVISQSGTIGSLTSVYGSEQGIGFEKFISSGNETDLHVEDFIEYLASDPETDVISVFMEGVKNGKRFFETTREAALEKPIVILKGGVTQAGAKAARSHTGSIACSTAVFNAAARQTGFIQANDEKDMIDLVKAFDMLPFPKGRNVGITGAWGGTGVLLSDACAREGLFVPELSKQSMEDLNKVLPSFWSHGNPVDITGAGLDGDFSTMTKPIEILLRDDHIHSVICFVPSLGSLFLKAATRMNEVVLKQFTKTALGAMEQKEVGMARELVELRRKYDKLLVAILIGFYGQQGSEHIKILEDNGIPVYETTTQAARIVSQLAGYREYRERSGD